MQLLEELERRVEQVLARATALEEDNRQLKHSVAGEVDRLRQENAALRLELDQAKQSRDAVLERIDRLLLKLRAAATDGQ